MALPGNIGPTSRENITNPLHSFGEAPPRPVPYGLKAVLKAFANQNAERQANVPGSKILDGKRIANLQKGEDIGGGFRFEREKNSGVEPGVVAKKNWKQDKDTQNLSKQDSKLRQFTLQQIENSQSIENKDFDDFKALIENIARELNPDATPEEISIFIKTSAGDILDNITGKGGEALNTLTNHLQNTYKKFTKEHFIKLAYEKPKRGHVSISTRRLMRIKQKNWFSAKIHSRTTRETPREKNFGAVVEALANDLYTKLGFKGQKLKLQLSTYDNKSQTPRFLLDSTAIQGFNDFRDQITEGHLDKNQVTLKKEGQEDVKLPIDEKMLAKAFLLSFLGADRDKVGGDGGNIGFTIKEPKSKKVDIPPDVDTESDSPAVGEAENREPKVVLQNIDPGKSLPYVKPKTEVKNAFLRAIVNRIGKITHFLFGATNLMKDYSLNSDFSFKPPRNTIKDRFLTMYANFSILQDTSLYNKVQAWREINTPENRAAINQLFDDYIETLDREGQQTLHFKKEINELKEAFNARFDAFDARLKKYEGLTESEINAIDHLEKLTSPTIGTYRAGSETKELVHLRVIAKTRVEWFKTENGGYQAKNLSKKSHDNVIKNLRLAGVTNFSISRQKNGKYNISVAQPLTQSEDEIRKLKEDRKIK